MQRLHVHARPHPPPPANRLQLRHAHRAAVASRALLTQQRRDLVHGAPGELQRLGLVAASGGGGVGGADALQSQLPPRPPVAEPADQRAELRLLHRRVLAEGGPVELAVGGLGALEDPARERLNLPRQALMQQLRQPPPRLQLLGVRAADQRLATPRSPWRRRPHGQQRRAPAAHPGLIETLSLGGKLADRGGAAQVARPPATPGQAGPFSGWARFDA